MRKSNFIKLTLSMLSIVVSSACTIAVKPDPIEIKRLVLLNQSSMTLSDVKIYVGKTREFATCGYILPKSECSIGFPLRNYQGNRFDLSWTESQRSRSVKNMAITNPENLATGKPVNAVIVFSENGRISARLQH